MLDYEVSKKFFADKLAEDFKGIGRFESAFYWTVVDAFNKGMAEMDMAELDYTDQAHPAWWRGYDAATVALCSRIEDILSGKDNGQGTCSEPWGTIRARLISAVGPTLKEARKFEYVYVAKNESVMLCRNDEDLTPVGVVGRFDVSTAMIKAKEWNARRRPVPKAMQPTSATPPSLVD
jgi:hypothetical protein